MKSEVLTYLDCGCSILENGTRIWCPTCMDGIFCDHEKQSKKVVIEVLGGVAEVTQCPEGVEVEIIDHDNERR